MVKEKGSERECTRQRVIDLEQMYGDYGWPDLMTVLMGMIASLEYKVQQLELKEESEEIMAGHRCTQDEYGLCFECDRPMDQSA